MTIINQNPPEQKLRLLRIRMRLNPGIELATECWQESLILGRIYHIAYLIQPPEVSVFIDDQPVCRNNYPTALTRGLHGLRIYHTYSVYGNFKVSRIVE